MTELIGLLVGALLGLVAVIIDRRRRSPQEPSVAPPPTHTAPEHHDALQDATASAVAAAADAHDVPAATVADDLDWLDADSSR